MPSALKATISTWTWVSKQKQFIWGQKLQKKIFVALVM